MQLEINSISKKYGKKIVLDNFTLTLSKGVYGLLGPNGAGKTTLIGIITGLIAPESGFVKYTDEKNRRLRDTIGYLPQYQNFYGNFTADEMLRYIMCLKNYKPAAPSVYVEQLLEKVNLRESRYKKLRTFSGGMKQRLGIAQALIGDPNVIIFDEPTAGLDPKERIRFRNVISSLGKDKIVILATHIVTDIAYIAKEIVLIKDGKLIFADSHNKVTESIKGKVWQCRCNESELIDKMNLFKVSNVMVDSDNVSIRILSDTKPFDNAEPVLPNLDDVCLYYFGEM